MADPRDPNNDPKNDPNNPPPPPRDGTQMPLGGEGKQNLIPINIEDEMRRSYLDYAMSVIIGRALARYPRRSEAGASPHSVRHVGNGPRVQPAVPQVRGHRRRSARAITIRTATRRCTTRWFAWRRIFRCAIRWWMARATSVRSMAIRPRPSGTPKRGSRASTPRCWKISTRKPSISGPTSTSASVEPEVLPTRVPNLLINGSSGIAVGMATNIPPHNLTEIINATILLVQNPDTHLSEIVNLVQGPDFPTGGFILGRQGILDYFTKGRGSLKLRAKAAIEKFGKDREAIVVTEIPYQVNKARLIEATAGLVNEKRLEGISEIRDESDRDGMRIVFELKRGEQAEVVLNNLYKHTQLQINFGVIMLSIVNGQPRELGLVDVLKRFIDHRIDVVRRRTDYLLRKAREREHLLLGFKKALENLDAVIKLIRASTSPREARDGLIRTFEFTERQAQAIIELQLQRLTGMEIAEDPRRTGRDPDGDRRIPGILGSDRSCAASSCRS